MRSLLNLAGAGDFEEGWRIIDRPGGDVTIVDVDTEDGASHWESLDHVNGMPVALSADREFPALRLLHKPLRPRQFLDLLEQVSNPGENVVTAEPAMVVTSERVEWLGLEVAGESNRLTLAEHLRRDTWRQPVMLIAEGWPRLVIDSGSGTWYWEGSMADMRPQLFAEPLPAEAGVPVSSADLADEAGRAKQRPLSELKWFAGLAQSRGRLHPDLLGEAQFMLAQVPLEAMDNERFAALARVLVRGPVSLEILRESSLETPANIACFLNACYTAGRLLVNRSARAAGF